MTPASNGGFKRDEAAAYWAARRDAQQVTVSCAYCRWRSSGLAGDVLKAQRVHARKVHGLEPQRKKIGGAGLSHSPPTAPPTDLAEDPSGTDRPRAQASELTAFGPSAPSSAGGSA